MTPDLNTSLEHCTFCPRLCSHTCPVSLASAREALTPQAKMAFFGQRRLGGALWPGSATEGAEPSSRRPLPIYACTGCGACSSACQHHVDPAGLLMQARADAEQAEAGPSVLADLPQRHAQILQRAAASLAAAPELKERLAQPGDIAFVPSCPTLDADAEADTRGPLREAMAYLRVTDRMRVERPDFPSTGIAALPVSCAGYPLYAAGLAEPFRLHAETFAHAVEAYDQLVLSCAPCTWLLRTQYAQHGVPLRPSVLHVSELLAPFAEALPVTRPLSAVNYHDPCHLGRRLGVYEPPRELLRRIAGRLCELPHHREDARCCGAGGLLPLTERALAGAMARDRVGELAESEQALAPLVSGCPSCTLHLRRSAPGVALGDLLILLDEASS